MIDKDMHTFLEAWSKAAIHQKASNTILGSDEAKDLIPIAERTLFVLDGFLDLIDELNYDKERFEELIFKLDDDYEQLREFKKRLVPLIASHAKLASLSDQILDRLMQAQNRLGLRVMRYER